MQPQDRWTEADAIAHAQRHGLALDPALTVRPPDLPDDTPEGTLLARVRQCAAQLSYLTYHTHDSRKSEVGFPDLCLARAATATSAGRLILAELKTRDGKVSREQHLWLDVLAHTIPGLEVYVWRPADFNAIVQILARK